MENRQDEKSIIENVISQIKSGDTKMRPRWYFVLKTTFYAISTILVSIILLFIVSLVIFILRKNGVIFVPLFGLRGLGVFILSLPWILISLSIAFVIVLEILIKHYSFSYKRPLLYSLLGIVVITSIGGVIIFKARMHDGLIKYAEDTKLSVIRTFYKEYGLQKLDNVYIGNIKEIFEDGFVMTDSHGENVAVAITENTTLPKNIHLEEGDNVVVLGDLRNWGIEAIGIRMLNNRAVEKLNNLERKQRRQMVR